MKHLIPILGILLILTSCTSTTVRRGVLEVKPKQEQLTADLIPLVSDKQKIDRTAFQYFVNGNLYELLGDSYRAAESYRKALQVYPDSYEIRYSLATNLHRMQDFQGVLAALDGIDPEDFEVLSLRGNVYRSIGFADSARACFVKLTSLDPNNSTVYSYLAGEYRALGLLDSTAWAYENLVRLRPKNHRLWQELGIIRLQQGDLESAKHCFESSIVLQSDSTNVMSFVGLGDIYQETGQLDSALIVYNRAVHIDPDNLLIHRGLASAYAMLDSLDQALFHTIREVQLAPFQMTSARRLGMMYFFMDSLAQSDSVFLSLVDAGDQHPLTYRYLGRIAVKNDDLEGGLHYFSLLTQVEDSIASNWLDLGTMYRLLKQPENEIQTYQTALQHLHNPEEYNTVMFALAVTYERVGPFEKSVEVFEELIARNPQHDQALNYLGYSLADRGVKLDYALELLTRAVAIQPDNPAYLDSFGWIYYKMAKYKPALKYLEQAAMLDNDPVIFDHLGDAYYTTGKRKEARQWWNRALELSPENQEIKEKLDH